jgi:hypothetical protein
MSRVRQNGGGSYWSYIENVDDYGNKTGFGTGSIMGVKRAIFASSPTATDQAFGAMLISSTDAGPT